MHTHIRILSFRQLLRMYYADCDGVVTVYDITNRESFYEAQKRVTQIRERVSMLTSVGIL